jgi:hypothetical protein
MPLAMHMLPRDLGAVQGWFLGACVLQASANGNPDKAVIETLLVPDVPHYMQDFSK